MSRAYHHGNLPLALIEAGAALAAQQGVDAVKVSVLAAQLGVSSAAPFKHFPTRSALLIAIAEEGARRQGLALMQAAAQHADPMLAQRAMGAAYVRWAVENPGFFRILSRAESLEGSALLQAQNAAMIAQMAAVLDPQSPSAGSAAVLAARALAYGLACMLVDRLLGEEISPAQAEQLADRVLTVLGSGLSPQRGS